MRRSAIAVILLALALPGLAQNQPFQEQIDVNAVLLDVIVTDSKGNQILGLAKDDFIVKEDGVAQTVDSVDYFTNRRLLTAREENAPFPVEHVRGERYFILFFDKPSDIGALHDQLTLARAAAREFIREDMMEGDQVAVVGHDVRLKVYSDFTSDKRRLERALTEATRFGRGITRAPEGEGPSILRNIEADTMMKRTGRVYEAIRVLAEALRPIRGRKNLVLFSPGIAEQEETISNGMITTRSRYFDPMIEALNGANATVYAAQLQRDVTLTPMFHQRLEEMAEATGGEYFRFNTTFERPLERVENVNNGYYLLTYRSRHPRGEKGFQKVEVSVRNPEFRVIARPGYQYGG